MPLCLAALATPRAAQAQQPHEWARQHGLDVLRYRADPRAAVSLARLRALRDVVDPVPLADRFGALARNAALSPALRAQASYAEAEAHRDLGAQNRANELVAALGMLTRWSVIGPFDNEGRNGFARAFGPETDRGARVTDDTHYDGIERSVRWRVVPPILRMGLVPLDSVVRPSVNACAYAQTLVTAPRAEGAVLWLGASGAIAAWVNGQEVFRDPIVRRASLDRAGVAVALRAGQNRVLLKVCTDERGMGFYARFTRPDGAPRVDLNPDPELAHAAAQAPPTALTVRPPSGTLYALQRAAQAPQASPEAWVNYARILHLTGADDPADPQAADYAERAAQGTTGPASLAAERWLLAADITPDRNRRREALRRAYALTPNDPHVLTALGHEARTGVRAEDALPYLEAALRLDPTSILAHVEYALVLDAVGFPLAAHRALEEVSGLAPRVALVLRARLALAEHAGQAEVAATLRRSLSQLRAADTDVLDAMARDARLVGDRDTVRALAERMLQTRPAHLSVHNTAAELFESIGDAERAVAVMAAATELVPDEPGLWSSRGELEARLNLPEAARASLRRALALRPQDASLRQHLEALEPSAPRADEAAAEAPEAFLARRAREADTRESYNIRSLQELTVRTVYPNGLSSNFRQIAYEVRTEQGARDGRSYALRYDPDGERIDLRAARVYHRDGSVDEGTQVNEFNVSSDPATRMYFSNRVVQLTFPHLSPGDVVEVRWRTDDVSPRNAFADYFGDLQIVQTGVPRAHFQYVLRAPAQREFFVYAAPLPGDQRIERRDAAEGDTRVYAFTASDVPAVQPEERAPGNTERAAYLHISTYRSWADVGRWYWGLVRDQLVLDDRLRAVVRELTRGLTTERDKVRAIYQWVITNTRYVALEFGIHGFKPYAVPQVCSRGFGDCKDKASVIVTMLREAGIDASLALVRTRNNGDIEDHPASLAIFDHAIAYVPSLDLYLDGTALHSGIDELPGGDQGVTALLVNQRGEARLARTPVYTPEQNTSDVTAELTLAPDGALALHTRQRVLGPDAPALRNTLEAEATRVERVEDQIRERYPGARVTRVTTNDLNNNEIAAELDYQATVARYGTRQGNALLVPLAPPLDLTRRYAPRSSRNLPLVVGVPSRATETRTLRLPTGATVRDVPPPTRLETPFGRFELAVTAEGTTVTVRRQLVLSRDRVTAQEYSEFRSFCQAVDEALGRRLTVALTAEGGAR